MERLPYIAVLAAYGFVSVWHLLALRTASADDRRRWRIAAFGVFVHLGTLGVGATQGVVIPGLPEALSATSLGIAIAYLLVANGRSKGLGLLLSPLATVVLGVAMVVPPHQVRALEETGYSPWLPIHLALVFSGIGGFALSSIVGVAYLWVRTRLKKKQFGGLRRLPSLETLDRIQFRAMLFGFIFLTLGIAAGGAWAAASLKGSWTFDPKVGFTVLIWLWYGIALQVRLVMGRRGRWTALFSIVGFGGLIFSLLGLNFLISGWHGYG